MITFISSGVYGGLIEFEYERKSQVTFHYYQEVYTKYWFQSFLNENWSLHHFKAHWN